MKENKHFSRRYRSIKESIGESLRREILDMFNEIRDGLSSAQKSGAFMSGIDVLVQTWDSGSPVFVQGAYNYYSGDIHVNAKEFLEDYDSLINSYMVKFDTMAEKANDALDKELNIKWNDVENGDLEEDDYYDEEQQLRDDYTMWSISVDLEKNPKDGIRGSMAVSVASGEEEVIDRDTLTASKIERWAKKKSESRSISMRKLYRKEAGGFLKNMEYTVFHKNPRGGDWIQDFSFDNLEEAEREAERESRNNQLAKIVDKRGKVVARYQDMLKKENRVMKTESLAGWTADPEDWTVVNTKEDGGDTHYGVKLWGGAGYFLSLYSVWADSMEEALTLVGEWCEKHEPGMIIRGDQVQKVIEDGMADIIEEDPEKYGFTEEQIDDLEDEKICELLRQKDLDAYWELYDKSFQDNYIDEWAFQTENPDIYLYSENLFIDEWPDDYPSPDEDTRESRIRRNLRRSVESKRSKKESLRRRITRR